ncbi:MAG: hypothetical protein HBSAPP03_17280 [Phycisphaerae bacterium]|nr:MAG: hypothetical protein HBSAPP03_17280 [Phycisphaerae bacterium]
MCAVVGVLWGCGGGGEKPRPVAVRPIVTRDVHPLFRGTIGAESELRGVQPVLVSGLGLVVGLNGTGGDILPEGVAATMEREMGLMGVGTKDAFRGTALEGKSPREVLRDRNTAVVVVQAAIPPGMPANATFDLVVRALNATSLEGGTLWTTQLRLGGASVFGGVQARVLGKARGPIFINPFAERGREQEGVTRTAGRVLDGGWVTDPFDIELVLDSNSHARARAVVSAINGRFPQGPGDPVQTARGRTVNESGGSIALHIPRRYRTQPGEFLELVSHLSIDPSFPEQQAKRLVEGVKAEPALAEDASWCLEAIGARALPMIRELYEYPELAPRMAGLKAGARLNDALAAGPLKEIARTGQGTVRTKAVELLGQLDGGPTVDLALQELLSEPLTVRVAAYEALAARVTRMQVRRLQQSLGAAGDAVRVSPTRLEVMAQERWPRRNFQGLERRQVGGKFFLDLVPFGEPLVYVTQQGQPRIVLFGADQSLKRPAVVSAWDDRLTILTEEGTTAVRVRHVPTTGGAAVERVVQADLVALIEYMAKDASPEDTSAGLGLSYSDVVGALSALVKGGMTSASLSTEQDKLRGMIASAAASQDAVERPEKPGDEPIVLQTAPGRVPTEDAATPRPKIVPIVPVNPR